MNILVTGGAGYIGSHVCKRLAQAGSRPVCFDNLSRGDRVSVRWGPLEVGDVMDKGRLLEVLRRYKPEGVIHLAGLASVSEGVADPRLYYGNNVQGSLSLLDAVRDVGIGSLIFSSTCATYGMPLQLPITESHPQKPTSPYGMSKLIVERILQDYSSAYGFRSITLRYFNAAGADPEGEIGEAHHPETHAAPLAIMAALDQAQAFRIFGTDYPTPDGTAIRDYVHVQDLADAHITALKYLLGGGTTDAFNLGTGVGTSVRELVAAIERIGGRIVPVERYTRRIGDPPALVADPKRAISTLGWQPKYNNIDDIVRTAWSWHCKNLRDDHI